MSIEPLVLLGALGQAQQSGASTSLACNHAGGRPVFSSRY
jgi:hypothetical protein